jgi:hypothetical protein
VERAERSGGLHKRSAEDWGVACGREGIPPLSGFGGCFCSSRRGVAGRADRPAEVGAEDAKQPQTGGDFLPEDF